MPPRELGVGAHAKHLYNLYVYFWRWATWKVFETHPGDRGVIAFVTVAGFLSGPGFKQMRRHMRRWADEIWVIDCSPEGHQPDVSTRFFPGVQQPICITIMVRDGSTGPDRASPLHFTSLSGHRKDKFAALATLQLDGPEWVGGAEEWHAPFLPRRADSWTAMPALGDLLPWSGSGTMPGRTWVIGTSPDTLTRRWDRLVSAPVEERAELLSEHRRDRRIDTQLSDNLPGYEPRGPIASERDAVPSPVRYGLRTLDRGWIIPDKRVINQPNPSLWQIREAPDQVFLTALEDRSPTRGPAASFTASVPDLHHFHGRGGRVFPLWLDSDGGRPNLLPGLVQLLTRAFSREVTAPDVFAYAAAILGGRDYVNRFRRDLQTSGLRIPLTAQPQLFERAVNVGKRLIWLHTYGERFIDAAAGRPASPPRVAFGSLRPSVDVSIPDDVSGMPETIEFDAETGTLSVGAGRISGVTTQMWEYETSGYKIIRRWFARRKLVPDGRRSSPLDEINATHWDPDWTAELVDLLHVLALLIDMDTQLDELLDEIVAGSLIAVDDLEAGGVLPTRDRLTPERPPRQNSLL
jgi:hypothetical protein